MFYWAAMFMILAIVAAVLGLGSLAGATADMVWVLLVIAMMFAVLRRRSPSV